MLMSIKKLSEVQRKAPNLDALTRFADGADDSKGAGPAAAGPAAPAVAVSKPAAATPAPRPEPKTRKDKNAYPWDEAREGATKKILIDLPEKQAMILQWLIENKIPGSQRRFITEAAVTAIDAKLKEVLKSE